VSRRWTDASQTATAAGIALLGWVPWLCKRGVHFPTTKVTGDWGQFYDRQCARCKRYRIRARGGSDE